MDRTLHLALDKFASVPLSLRIDAATDVAIDQVSVSLARLYHHYYWDNYGMAPPDPGPAHFEYLQFLVPSPEFRIRGKGLGSSPGAKRNRSMELGQAFCRWLLEEHLDTTFVAHISDVIERQLVTPFQSGVLSRKDDGDAPDYLCARGAFDPCLAEAKGRYDAISFGSKDFSKWRKQFSRVEFRNPSGQLESLKGYIVATRFATEDVKSSKTTLFAEDPQSPGDRPINDNARGELADAVMSIHYGRIAQKLAQPILAASLRNGFQVAPEILFPAFVWELQAGPLQGARYVGGYHPSRDGVRIVSFKDRVQFMRDDPLRLGLGSGTFVGVKESTFERMVARARRGRFAEPGFEGLAPPPFFYSGVSTLRDGSIVGPVEFFRPVEPVVY
jgi:hypothetical protein